MAENEKLTQTAYGSVPVPDPTVLTTEAQKASIMALRELIETRLNAYDKAILLLQEFANRQPTIAEVVAKYDQQIHAIDERFEERDRRFDLRDLDNKRAVDAAFSAAKEAVKEQQTTNYIASEKAQAAFALQIAQIKELFTEKIGLIKISFDEKLGDAIATIDEKFDSIATQFRERDTRTEQTARDSKVAVDAALSAAKEAVGEQNKSNALAIAKSEAAFTKQIDQIGAIINAQAKGVDDKVDDLKSRLIAIENRVVPTVTKENNNTIWIVGGIFLLIVFGLVMFNFSKVQSIPFQPTPTIQVEPRN